MSSLGILSWAGLEVSFQRIGLASWSAEGILRSWSAAPWRAVPDGVAIACFPMEALWLGLSNANAPVTARLESQGGRWSREIVVPPDWQLGWIRNGVQTKPIALSRGHQSARFRLRAQRVEGPTPATLSVVLLAPEAWRKGLGPLDLEPAVEPAPVIRYSRVVLPEAKASPASDTNVYRLSDGKLNSDQR
jgi:hypothetical protein